MPKGNIKTHNDDTTDHLQGNHEEEREKMTYTYHDYECDEVDNV